MSKRKNILLIIISIVLLVIIYEGLMFMDGYIHMIHSLDDYKKEYVESLTIDNNPEKIKQFKQSGYYQKMMNAKTRDSVRYWYVQFLKQPDSR